MATSGLRNLPYSITNEAGVFECSRPTQQSRIIISSPHSGSTYPSDFNYTCQPGQVVRLEDRFINELVETPQILQRVHVVKALFPRSYIDPNRALDCLAPEQVSGGLSTLPYAKDKDGKPLLDDLSGLVFLGSEIGGFRIYEHGQEPTEQDIQRRMEYWHQYHNTLTNVFNELAEQRPSAPVYHIDLHSCWRNGKEKDGKRPVRPDVILSNAKGKTCSQDFLQTVATVMSSHGLSVGINDPFKGGYGVTSRGKPEEGIHSLQIEFVRDLYMDETTLQINTDGVARLQNVMGDVVSKIESYQGEAPTPSTAPSRQPHPELAVAI